MNVLSNAATAGTATARPVSANNSPEGAAPSRQAPIVVKDSLDISAALSTAGDVANIAGSVAKHASRAIPGAINVALNSPNLIASPVLNAFAPATNNREAIYLERWGNVLGGAALGGVAGAVLTNILAGDASVGQILGMGTLGALGGGVAGGAKSLISAIWTPTVYQGGAWCSKAKYPQIGKAASAARYSASAKSYGAGAALRAGYKAGFFQSYENGARLADELGNFSKGLFGLQE
ncbi:MAG TPA: hypothetical protein EYO33_21255 [Phycisphaerales bacterium]|nr:hypothetical protein [Phycisphaerales bacterium]